MLAVSAGPLSPELRPSLHNFAHKFIELCRLFAVKLGCTPCICGSQITVSATSNRVSTQLQCPQPVTVSATSHSVRNQSQCPQPVTVSATSDSVSNQLQCPQPVTVSATSYSVSNQLQCPQPVTVSATSYSVCNQSQCQQPVTVSATRYMGCSETVTPSMWCVLHNVKPECITSIVGRLIAQGSTLRRVASSQWTIRYDMDWHSSCRVTESHRDVLKQGNALEYDVEEAQA